MSSGFVSEAEAAEIRKKRQEEWEKVRKPTDPVERPEEPYDNRSLFDKLQEQKQKKDLEYEEAHKFKNMIRGLDDDESEYLDLVDRTKIAANRKKELEEARELIDYKNRVVTLEEKHIEKRLQTKIPNKKDKKPSATKFNQHKLLKGIVVTKNEATKRTSSTFNEENEKLIGDKSSTSPKRQKINESTKTEKEDTCEVSSIHNNEDQGSGDSSAMICVAVLPGLGCYESSSDENSSDSDEPTIEKTIKTDLTGRKIQKMNEEHKK